MYEELLKGYKTMGLTYICPDFRNYYSSFVYDEEIKSYVYTGDGIRGTYPFEGVEEYEKTTYYRVELKIINGKLAYVRLFSGKNEDGSFTYDDSIYFYDFGTTVINLPEGKN